MKNTEFDFKAAGYESPADWARLWDLVPKLSADTTNKQRDAHGLYEKGGRKGPRTKALMLALLGTYGIKPEPYNAEVAAVRNVA